MKIEVDIPIEDFNYECWGNCDSTGLLLLADWR